MNLVNQSHRAICAQHFKTKIPIPISLLHVLVWSTTLCDILRWNTFQKLVSLFHCYCFIVSTILIEVGWIKKFFKWSMFFSIPIHVPLIFQDNSYFTMEISFGVAKKTVVIFVDLSKKRWITVKLSKLLNNNPRVTDISRKQWGVIKNFTHSVLH